MNRMISLVLFVIGVVLIIFGVMAMDSFSSDVSRFFTGTPTDKAVWMSMAGAVLAVVGLSGPPSLACAQKTEGGGRFGQGHVPWPGRPCLRAFHVVYRANHRRNQ